MCTHSFKVISMFSRSIKLYLSSEAARGCDVRGCLKSALTEVGPLIDALEMIKVGTGLIDAVMSLPNTGGLRWSRLKEDSVWDHLPPNVT